MDKIFKPKETTTTRVLYRKLSLKSKMQFGKFADHTVQELVNIREFDYLRWVYYCMSNIDYLPEVKEIVGIPMDIEKPGTNEEFYRKWQEEFFQALKGKHLEERKPWEEMTEDEKLKVFKMASTKKANIKRKKKIAEAQQARRENARELTPAQLQGMNAGHGRSRKRNLYK